MAEPLVVAVVGPTAAGKSDLSVALCKRLGGEVVNADAMQVYRGMDIGTAKISTTERDGVPHHLLDILDVTETATVAEFQQLARAAIDDCVTRERGTGPGRRIRAVHPRDPRRLRLPGHRRDVRSQARRRSSTPKAQGHCTRG